MDILKVKADSADYPIYINDSFNELKKAVEKAGINGGKACIICDSNTERLYLQEVMALLKDCFSHICYFSFEAGENSKKLEVISQIYGCLVENKLDRKSTLIALGGGVVGDMTGFAAATYMRGISFVQIPTTLLAQVDSSVGGKTGVDFMGNKNMIGAFYQPKFVYINSKTLETLPPREFSAGMGEVIKYGYIIDKAYLEMLEEKKNEIKALDTEAIHKVIYGACESKAYVVSKDEKENGLRAILNFGHTFGHAVESLSDFKLIHGECVAIGMMSALYLSEKMGMIENKELERAKKLLEFFDLPTSVKGFDKNEILDKMLLDKKTKNNVINLVLLEEIGKAYIDKSTSKEAMLEAISYIAL